MRNIIGVDSQFVYYTIKKSKKKLRFPYRALRDLVEGQGDEVLEMYAPAVRLPPSDSSDEAIANSYQMYMRFSTMIEGQGVSVIEAPAKQIGNGGIKHSDDQRLMIRLALACTRLKPDFLVLVAADGDYAPLVWGLREEGIRTKLITAYEYLAPELQRAVYSTSDIWKVMEKATAESDDYVPY